MAPDLPAANQRSGELTARASGAMKGHGKVRRLFSSRARQEAAASAAPVLAELAEFLEHARALLSAIKATSLTDDVLWQHYRQNNSDFVATLESSGVRAAVAVSASGGAVAPGQQRGGSWPGQQSVRVPAGPPPPPDPFGNLPPELAKAIEAFDLKPGPLTASLRRYQEFGARFLAVQGRSVLGDDMGLGKTVEVLACMCHLHALGKRHFFVVAPNSVCINWVREVNKHTRLAAFLVHGQGRETMLRQWQSEGGVAITTYGTLAAVAPQIGSVDLLVADEAHLIKNPSATRTTVFRNLAGNAKGVALLTGTALENRLEEMGSIVSLVRPNLSYLVDQLVNVFQPDPLETRHRLAEVYLRRTQRDVLTELPEMTQVEEWVTLEGDHLRTYQAALLSSLMAARQAAVVGADRVDSPKLERLGELLENYRSEGRKVVVFSFFRRVLDLVSQVAGGCAQINGSVPAAERQRIIDAFSNTQGFAVLASQIDAGGLGVNLQAANVVVLMEPQWKPSTERQAVARVHRMGQVDKVMVHRLLARDTVEEWMIKLLAAKQVTFDTYADPSSLKDASAMAADGAMPAIDAELRAMIEQQRARVSL
ncbi:MAG: DEAD/DEAH box helicase, partial [Actinomycetota bacterium]